MPKKRSVVYGFSKGLQRTLQRATRGPALPPQQATPAEGQESPATAAPATPKTHHDMAALIAAQNKRLRKAAARQRS